MKLDPVAEFIVQAQQQRAQAEAEAEPSRETRLRPHETGRKSRQMNVTFPTGAWTEAIREMAERWGLRPGDLVVWCVSHAIDAIKDGRVPAPSGTERRQHHKAMEWTQLPWEPEEIE